MKKQKKIIKVNLNLYHIDVMKRVRELRNLFIHKINEKQERYSKLATEE